MSDGRLAVLALFAFGCTKAPPQAIVPSADAALLAMADARPVPSALRSRFGFKIESEAVAGGTGGALIVDRPGRGHLAVLSPLGGPLLTLHTDGKGLSVIDKRNRVQRITSDAEKTLRDATEGLAGVDEVLGLLVGDLPLDGLEIRERSRTDEGDLKLLLSGPRHTLVELTLDDPLATPIALQVSDQQGDALLSADYGPFEPLDKSAEEPTYMPSEVSVTVSRFAVTLHVRFKKWETLGDSVPEVFSLDAPDGFTTIPLDLSQLAPVSSAGMR